MKYYELRKGDKPLKSNAAYLESWDFVTQPVVDAVIPALKEKFWDDLSPRLYVSFWTLSMFDLEVPKPSYDREVDRLKALIQSTEENKDLPPSKKKKEVERGRLLQEKLLEEQLKQDEHVRKVRVRLEQEKEQWFQSSMCSTENTNKESKIQRLTDHQITDSAKSEMTTQFFQHCLFPRCVFTASDAFYCAKFVHLLHTLKTPNFSTLICYDRVSNQMRALLDSVTILIMICRYSETSLIPCALVPKTRQTTMGAFWPPFLRWCQDGIKTRQSLISSVPSFQVL